MIKREKGITLISLIITIALMLIISSVAVHTSLDRFEINKYNKMVNDIELLSDKVSNYYLKYNGLPILRDNDNNPIEYTYTQVDFSSTDKDNGNYYILDLTAMEAISLNYGKEGFESPNTSDDVYIINKSSHQIYYVRGMELNDTIYHTIKKEGTIEDTIPPSKPQIKVISGTQNHDGTYMTNIEVEIIPGKNEGNLANKTEFSIDDGNTWEDITTSTKLTSNIYKITEDGTHNISARSYDEKGNVSENEIEITTAILGIGDKVEYNEGTGYTSDIDTNFVMKDMKWRILDIEEDGTIDLISTQPTDSTLTLSGDQGWLKGEENLDKLCNDLYGNGTDGDGNTIVKQARSLKVKDIDKLAKYNPSTYDRYGTKWQYQYSATDEIIQYRKLAEDGTTWSEWSNVEKTYYKNFYEPGKEVINKNNYQDASGNQITANLESTAYAYVYGHGNNKISSTTSDGISISTLISYGLNNDNTTYQNETFQWLSSRYTDCDVDGVDFGFNEIRNNSSFVGTVALRSAYGQENSVERVVRPVVTLNKDIKLTKVDGMWQIN